MPADLAIQRILGRKAATPWSAARPPAAAQAGEALNNAIIKLGQKRRRVSFAENPVHLAATAALQAGLEVAPPVPTLFGAQSLLTLTMKAKTSSLSTTTGVGAKGPLKSLLRSRLPRGNRLPRLSRGYNALGPREIMPRQKTTSLTSIMTALPSRLLLTFGAIEVSLPWRRPSPGAPSHLVERKDRVRLHCVPLTLQRA